MAKRVLFGIEQCNCFTVRKAARQISRFYDAHLKPVNLRITQFLILTFLSDHERASLSELGDRLDVEQTAIGKMVSTLARDGLVSVRPAPEDGRSRLVELTDKGRDVLARALPLWRKAQSAFNAANDSKTIDALRPGFQFES